MIIITDVDGILASPNLTYSKNGKELKHFSVNDSLMIKLLKNQLGIETLALTGDTTGFEITQKRCDDIGLNVNFCLNKDKLKWITNNFYMKDVVYLGDDLYDYFIFTKCHFSGTTYIAPEFLRENANYVSKTKGGEGAFTEIILEFLKHEGHDIIQLLANEMLHKTLIEGLDK